MSVDLAGDVALEVAADFCGGFALGASLLDVGLGGGVSLHAVLRDDVEDVVELAVAEAVQSVSHGLSG